MEIFDAFLNSPFWFVIGFILAGLMWIFKNIMVRFNQRPAYALKKPNVLEHTQVSAIIEKEFDMEQVGIKEVKEVLVGLDAIGYVAYNNFKGEGSIQEKLIKFAGAVVSDKELHAKLIAAFEGNDKLKEEFKDLSIQEGFEIGGLMLGLLPKYFIKK